MLDSLYLRILQQKAWNVPSSLLSTFFRVVYSLPSVCLSSLFHIGSEWAPFRSTGSTAALRCRSPSLPLGVSFALWISSCERKQQCFFVCNPSCESLGASGYFFFAILIGRWNKAGPASIQLGVWPEELQCSWRVVFYQSFWPCGSHPWVQADGHGFAQGRYPCGDGRGLQSYGCDWG